MLNTSNLMSDSDVNMQECYSALQVSCLAGVVNEQLSMSLYKLIAFVLCTITELSHCLFTLSSGQLSCKAL